MKILVLQLARLGDIYLTWPSVRALRRTYPEAEIHMLVRPRFADACSGLKAVDQIKLLPSEDFFKPVYDLSISDEIAAEQTISELNIFLTELKIEEYDQVINLSFSPVSSYIVDLIKREKTEIRGYSRYTDGFLSIEDDASAYFYAQVGVGKHNRFHLADLFSEVIGIALTEEDWNQEIQTSLPPLVSSLLSSNEYIVVHIAASQQKKSLTKEKWAFVLNRVTKMTNKKIFLIGSEADKEISDYILLNCKSESLCSLVGRTSLSDLFGIIKGAKQLVGADSGPIHIASLLATPVFNISNSSVRFWETGPKSAGSRIFVTKDFEALGSDRLATEIIAHLNSAIASDEVARVQGPTQAYEYFEDENTGFEWKLIQALYLGADFPVPRNRNFVDALSQLQELNILSLQQFYSILKKEEHEENMAMLNTVDDFVSKLVEMVPEIQPLVSWYQTEKLRVGPDSKHVIVSRYTEIHENLAKILSIYLGDTKLTTETQKQGELYANK